MALLSMHSDECLYEKILYPKLGRCMDVEKNQEVPLEFLGDILNLAVLLRQHNQEVTGVKSLNDQF